MLCFTATSGHEIEEASYSLSTSCEQSLNHCLRFMDSIELVRRLSRSISTLLLHVLQRQDINNHVKHRLHVCIALASSKEAEHWADERMRDWAGHS
jgi:hypothetical protein